MHECVFMRVTSWDLSANLNVEKKHYYTWAIDLFCAILKTSLLYYIVMIS